MPKAKTTKSGNIIMLPVTKLHPHPDNPRDDLGDLTELSASIARNGVLQNLTVVESSDGYTVVIGHRRLAAAKKEEAARAERMRKLSDAFEAAYKSRREFITKGDLIMANVPDVMQFLYDAASKNNSEPEEFAEIVGLDPANYTDDDDYGRMAEDTRGLIAVEYIPEKCRSALKNMKRHCVLFAYVMWGDSGSRCGVDSAGRFHDDWGGIAELRKLYGYLDRFGYDISDDEAELLDGTSELYLHEEEET